MPEYHRGQQQSPSPSSKTGPMLPPLSKYYYGPAQGWNSTESSPSHNGSSWSVNHHDIPPTLPPRLSPGPQPRSSPQWMNHSPYSAETLQGWHSPSPLHSAPTVSQVANVPQLSDGYTPMPITSHSHSHSYINPTWDSGPLDTSTWGVKHNRKAAQGSEPTSKPPLPPRPHNLKSDQPLSPLPKTPSSRLSATTIDVPLFLQPIAYDPTSAPLLPGVHHSLPEDVEISKPSLPEPERLPPPPPQKIPLAHVNIPQATKLVPQHPGHDLKDSCDHGLLEDSQMSQHLGFDVHIPHNTGKSPRKWQSHEQRPTIPVPQFTSFDVGSALPPPELQPELSFSQQQIVPQSSTAVESADLNRLESCSESSTSPVGPSTADRCISTSTPWESQASYAPSLEQQHSALAPPDKQSVSTTNLSINTASNPTPGSHQTSDTSYRGNENQGKTEQNGDDSFYWHSGRSSSEGEEDQGQSGFPTATPGARSIGQKRSSATTSMGLQREYRDLPIRSTSLSPTTSATYGASALGFGGPSDWEYFGDYEAEEIDDEELYTRPRLRDLSGVDGITELPVESRLEFTEPRTSESVPPSSELMQLGDPPRHAILSSRSLRKSSSQENAVQDQVLSVGGDFATNTKPQSARSPDTPPATSDQAVLPSESHSQQRPDLDDVIRAWSEAPHVGKVRGVLSNAAVLPDDKEPADIAEASLASTPREKILGVNVTPKGAPSLPKIPGSCESSGLAEGELQRSANACATPQNAVSPAQHHEHQIQLSSNQQEPTTDDISMSTEAWPRKEEKRISESEDREHVIWPPVDVTTSPPVDVMVLSGLSPLNRTESSENKMRLHVDSSRDRYTDSDETSHGLLPMSNLKSDQQIVPNEVQVTLHSEHQGDTKKSSEGPKSELLRKSEGNGLYESIAKATSTLIGSLEHSLESVEIAPDDPSPSMLCNTPKENLGAGDSIKPRQDHPQEDVKTSTTHATSDQPRSKDIVTSAPTQLTLSSLSSNASLARHSTPTEVGTIQDPYSDLDPWGKASLNRFAAMLREESRAETNQEKLNIFNVFTSRESRLRIILYGTDEELIIPQKSVQQNVATGKHPEKRGFVKQAVERANSIGLERSLKALPALPVNRESGTYLPANNQSPSIIPHGLMNKGRLIDARITSLESTSELLGQREVPSGPSDNDSYVMINPAKDEIQYSPGGRPVVTRLVKTASGPDVQDKISATKKASAASSGAPGSSRRAHSPSSNRPIVRLKDPEVSETPAYTPIKDNEARSEVKNYLANRKSVCRPYATLTQGSLESASNFGKEEDIKLAGTASIILAPTSQFNSVSQAKEDGLIAMNQQKAPRPEEPADLRRFVKADFDPLILALPDSDAVIHASARILDLRSVMEAVPEDFSFIHQSVVAWDAKAKKQREDNDRQRHARQAESEQKIDMLFDEHEIGYGDIAELETEFKRSEAARKADEDRFEYQTFVSDVFDLVWTRLHYELDQLIPHYDQYSNLMDQTLAGKDMFEHSQEGLALGPTMSSFLALHQKVEIRHQKAFEAVLERDRRLKKTEISPWYTLSNIAKVKQLEKQFEDAEKKAIIKYCLQRDARANHLMDVLDQNTLRGVGANQDYMEAIMKAVRRIASGRAFASVPGINEPTVGLEGVEKAKVITTLLASSSEQIVQTFHVADMLLNSADYEVSVAKAKVAKADVATLTRLKEERAKEDQKLMRDLEHRLALIREDTRRTNDEIVKLMLFLGVQLGRADSVPAQAEPIDPQHEARMQKALEEAKTRNALKESATGHT